MGVQAGSFYIQRGDGDHSLRFLDQSDVGMGRRGSESDEDFETNEESYDVRATGAYPEFRPRVEYPGSRLHGIELPRVRSDARRSGSLPQKPAGRRRPSAVSKSVDTHGKRMLTGWEFWLLFSILSLRECHCYLAENWKMCSPSCIVSGTGLMCEG